MPGGTPGSKMLHGAQWLHLAVVLIQFCSQKLFKIIALGWGINVAFHLNIALIRRSPLTFYLSRFIIRPRSLKRGIIK
jgi:hypothetical protein